MSYFEGQNFRMHYEIYPGIVPADTVFLHGNLASNNWWKPSLAVWEKESKGKNYKGSVICAEWRGCGKSSGPDSEEQLKLEILGKDYVDLLTHLKISKVNLVGHSTGGLIGLYAVKLKPELFQRLVMLDSVAATGIQFGPEMYAAFTQMSENRAMCDAVISGTIFSESIDADLRKQLVDDAFHVHPLIWHGVAKMLHNIDFREEVKTITQPSLVLHGEKDTLLPIAGSKELAELLPNGRFYEIPNQGHSCNMENPGLFVKMVNEFLFG